MQWILIFGNGIEVSREELVLRRNFIGSVTGADVTPWQPVILNGRVCPTCAITCESNDDINGLLITGHVYDLRYFYPLIDRKKPEFVILNTCALFSELREVILTWLMRSVPNVSLYYAHQKRTLTGQYVNLSYEGNFGFQTSVSERKLFRNRKKGLREAITLAFDHISS